MKMPLTTRAFEPMSLPPLPAEPLFSVLIRNYNYAQYLGIAVESVLHQTYRNFELIICDDGSTDNSRELARHFVRSDHRVKLITQDNQGAATAANRAYESCQGELIAFLDADDSFSVSKLETVLTAFIKHPKAGLCINPVLPISGSGQPVGPSFPVNLREGWIGVEKLSEGGCTSFPPASGLAFRREIAAQIFPIPAGIRIMEDFFLAGTAQFLTQVCVAGEPLTEFRVHKASDGTGTDLRPAFSTFRPKVHVSCVNALETVLPAVKERLREIYGNEIAEALRLEDNPGYWNVLLALRALAGRSEGMIRLYSTKEMIRHVPRPAERCIWQAILLLPQPLANRAYRFWRTPSRIKSIMKAAVLPLIRRV